MSKLAEKIATEIMTVHGRGPTIVERIQMMKRQADGTESDFGGRNFTSVVSAIDRILSE